jgi:hypothetical protein
MDEYDHRDCAADKDAGFSSYAYLIGLLRSLDHSIYGVSRPLKANIKTLCTKTDESMAAWLLLLPKNKQKLFTEDGSFDEVLFKANSLLQVLVDPSPCHWSIIAQSCFLFFSAALRHAPASPNLDRRN